MALRVEMRDRDGLLFRQWRREHRGEELPDDGLYCVCCNARAVETAVHPAVAKEGPAVRMVMTHDYHLHATWQGAGPGYSEAQPIQAPRRALAYADD